ncbi:hypothetical protein [Streptococcus sp. zg-JUN1979]|uniref:hypothetical protein n=1 Tax=Streptococcus sp. zg-JUN1979 TaxID=3391450 RepID=UPI0039A66A0D
MKQLSILALAESAEQEHYFTQLAESFTYLFEISIKPKPSSFATDDVDAIFSFSALNQTHHQLLFSFTDKEDTILANHEDFSNPKALIRLAAQLSDFYYHLAFSLLDNLPYRLSLYDKKGSVFYSNQAPLAPLEPFQAEESLDSWFKTQLQHTKSKSLHMTQANLSFDTLMMDSYYSVTDTKNQPLGYLRLAQDIKPLLESYLAESGQALVGWSDVTSGPSMSDDGFEL